MVLVEKYERIAKKHRHQTYKAFETRGTNIFSIYKGREHPPTYCLKKVQKFCENNFLTFISYFTKILVFIKYLQKNWCKSASKCSWIRIHWRFYTNLSIFSGVTGFTGKFTPFPLASVTHFAALQTYFENSGSNASSFKSKLPANFIYEFTMPQKYQPAHSNRPNFNDPSM